MDLAWRVVVDFLLQGSSTRVQAAVDDHQLTLLIHDPSLTLSTKRLRSWNRISDVQTTSPERRSHVDKALETRDIVKMKQCLRTLIHFVCLKIRFVSQEAGSARSVHYVFQSRIFSATPAAVCTHGPHASFYEGISILVTVHASLQKMISQVFGFNPVLQQNASLWEEAGRDLLSSSHGLHTPRRVDESTMSVTEGTPNAKEDLVRCETCLRLAPLSSCFFAESCCHVFCLTCITACAIKHCEAPFATPSNMPCPSFCCTAFILPSEMRWITSVEQFADLEYNEVRLALREDCAECPCCSFTFESFLSNDVGDDDPLKDKVRCVACEATFCRRCQVSPFHEGKPCRDGGTGKFAPKCRYCGNAAASQDPQVCDSKECEAKGRLTCSTSKQCGHLCHGTTGEHVCVTCLEDGCSDKHEIHSADDFCVICYTDALRDAPCLELECGHIFHFHCLQSKLEKRWPTARINFNFFTCPLCSRDVAHHLLSKFIEPVKKLRDSLESRYIERLKIEGLWDVAALTDQSSIYFQRPLQFAKDKFNYYLCSKCNRPYFGGLRECQDIDREEPDRADLICGGCSAGSAVCAKHGNQFMEWKCKYCCNTAVWYCWGTTHFCELCHSPPRKSVREECPGEELCPLRGQHQPNGAEFAIGCAMCRAEAVDKKQ